jgi:hypothetical protein
MRDENCNILPRHDIERLVVLLLYTILFDAADALPRVIIMQIRLVLRPN